jgi:hypothetical protein
MSATTKAFVIVRSWWNYNDEWTEGDDETLKAFADRAVAEAYLERCRVRARAERGEYIQGGVGYRLVEVDMPASDPIQTEGP